MFTKEEIKRNLLGCLDVALFMPHAAQRFGSTYDEALRSFYIPAVLFPLSLLAVYLFPSPELGNASSNTIALLYTLRFVLSLGLFLGFVWLIAVRTDRQEYFYQFIVANNWINVPTVAVFIPIGWMLFSGSHTVTELYPAMTCLLLYTYGLTAYMTARILRIPWELAGFITVIAMGVNNHSVELVHWAAQSL